MNTKRPSYGHMIALFTMLMWGTTFVATKVLLRAFTPVEILFYRFVIGYGALWLFCPHRLRLTERKQEWYFVGAGLCGVTLYYLSENVALTYSLASSVGVIVSIAPMFTAILAHFFLDGEPLRPRFVFGFVSAILGIGLISWNGTAALQLNPIGDLLAVFAAFIWAVYSILGRKISAFGYNTMQTTRRTFLYGILFMVPSLALFGFRFGFARFAEPVYLGNMIFLSLGASAVCFVTWNLAVRILGAVKTSVYIYLQPVISVLGAGLILHERLTPVTLLGTALTLCGLLLSEWRMPQKIKT
ncbi:MAG: DMT family transporter [Clostridia bacterium]|nr:DMT family transporter [Clostridia bacterium]